MPEKSTPIQVVTWNVHFQGASILDALRGQPDVLTLQEVTFNQRPDFEERLCDMGLKCCPDRHGNSGGKPYGNLIATRWKIGPVTPRYSRKEPPWPELLVKASVSVNGRSFLVISVHIPNGSGYGWQKIDTFNALKGAVREAKGKVCIVTGDFNEPRYTLQNGRIVTWGQEWDARQRRFVCWPPWKDRSGTLGSGKKWDSAVRWLFEEEDEHGMRHAYWDVHGPGSMDVSHLSRGQKRWFDHIFVSPHFGVEQCEYLHELRRPGLSDHSALEAKLVLKP
jgi:endonuclease/exonuclease/phosphatase family metal-dependent hydrolase